MPLLPDLRGSAGRTGAIHRLTAPRTAYAVGRVPRMTDTPPTRAHLRLDRRDDGVAVLTLDNPDQRNAMSDEMTASWVAAVDELAGDRDLRAVVVTGAGQRVLLGRQHRLDRQRAGRRPWTTSAPG